MEKESLILDIENFGSIDAESDKRLLNYFIKTDSLERVLNYKKSIIVGRKGSGKTALYKYIENSIDNSKGLLFKDYPWRVHDEYRNSIVSEQESFVSSWLFLIYIEFIKLIVKDIESYDKKTRKEIKKLRKWLKRNWGTSDFDFKNTFSPKKRYLNWSIKPQIFGCGLGSVTSSCEKSHNLSNSLSEINKSLKRILVEITKQNQQYSLLFDELDLGYNPKDEIYKTRIIGLLISAYSVFNNLGSNLKVYVFLRSDILKELTFQDKNKINDNIIEELNWNAENEEVNLSLKKLVSIRIKENIGSETESFSKNWNSIFDKKNIGRNQKKWNYLIERTFLRPRDVIKFLNLSLEVAKSRIKKQNKSSLKITNPDIQGCKKDYSNYLYKELSDEVKTKYPEFDHYLEILREIHNTNFTINEFNTAYENVSKRLSLNKSNSEIIELLYEFSVVGFYKAGGGGYGGSTYCFNYIDPNIKFNPKATKFKTHPGFKEYLELIERK